MFVTNFCYYFLFVLIGIDGFFFLEALYTEFGIMKYPGVQLRTITSFL